MSADEQPEGEPRDGEPPADEFAEPMPGERLLYALGQLWWRWRVDPEGSVPPERIDIEAVARMLGVWTDVEFIQDGEREDSHERYVHFGGEVLVADHSERFPWTLMDTREWAGRQEAREFWRYHH